MAKNKCARILAMLLGGVMSVSLLVGCGSQANTSQDASTSDSAASETKTKDGDKKVIEFWHIQTQGEVPAIIQDSVDRYMADNPDCEVKVTIMANDAYKQKISVAMSSGQMPDVITSWGGGPMNEYVDAGTIIDLTEYMDKDNYKDKFLTAAIQQASYKDKIYGMPVENVAISGFFYNKEMFDEYGLTEPKTVAELEAVCDKLIENGKIPFSLANKTQWTGAMYFINLATRYGGVEPFKKAISGEGSFEDPAFEYAGTKIQEWVDKGYFNVGFNGADEDSGQSRQLLYTEDAAMTLIGSWFVTTAGGENPEFVEKVGFFTFPEIEGAAGDPKIVVGTIGDNMYHITSSCKYPDEAFEMMTYLLDDTAVAGRLATGRIPPLNGMTLDKPILQTIFANVEAAPDVQLWYDQALPPEVAQVHKNTSQEIFGKTLTPAEADKQLQEAMQAYLQKKK